MLNDLLLLSKNPIPFEEATIMIYNPTAKEIGMIGEDSFYTGCELLTFSKDILTEQDRNNLVNQSDFDVLMSIMTDKRQTALLKNKVCALMVLALIFPEYQIEFKPNEIQLIKEGEVHSINSNNFEKFKEILNAMFCLKGNSEESPTYNPGGDLARQIAEKFKKRQSVVAKQKGPQKIAILSRYISILAVGQKKDMNDLLNYTVYQLFDEMRRFELKEAHDLYIRYRLAGARDLKEVDNWKQDIHP